MNSEYKKCDKHFNSLLENKFFLFENSISTQVQSQFIEYEWIKFDIQKKQRENTYFSENYC